MPTLGLKIAQNQVWVRLGWVGLRGLVVFLIFSLGASHLGQNGQNII